MLLFKPFRVDLPPRNPVGSRPWRLQKRLFKKKATCGGGGKV